VNSSLSRKTRLVRMALEDSGFMARSVRRFALTVPLLLLPLVLAGCATKPPDRLAADQVVVKKSERKLVLMHGGEVIREYRIALGDAPRGHKMRQGDERTPEGDYILDWRNPRSSFYKSIHVSYPNQRDRMFARAMGVDPGGMIVIRPPASFRPEI